MRYTYRATINYPDDEQDTPDFRGNTIEQVCDLVRRLLTEEGDVLTSAVIVLSKEAKP